VLPLDLLAFAGEGPALRVEQQLLFPDGRRDLVDFQILEEVDAAFAGGGEVDVAVAIEVGNDELRANSRGAV